MDVRSRLRNFAFSRPVTLIFAIIANVSALVGLAQFFGLTPGSPLTQIATVVFTGATGGFVVWATYITHLENARLKTCASELHQINHSYRDALCEVFFDGQVLDDDELLDKEREALTTVTGKIANIFWCLTNRKCMVTVYLLEQENGETVTFSWARSEKDIEREPRPLRKFKVTPENTRFHEATLLRPTGPAHFFGGDLEVLYKQTKYHDLNSGWERLYKSCIAVPIRFLKCGSEGPAHSDALGFLVVDTKHPNRLNDDFHVQYLAAFADQMYNYLSLMRRRYQR